MPRTQIPPEQALRTLPGDDIRQSLWGFADRYDVQMLVQSVRALARGPVAQLVAAGGRNTHEWTDAKAGLLKHYDEAGVTAVFLDPAEGGFIEGPKNLALALTAFELAWVDGGAATCALASHLGLSPIHERGTPEQVHHYMGLAAPPAPGEDRKPTRVAFCLTEPIPYVGVETGLLGGKVRVDSWKEGEEPILHVDKRGRFITNMAFANLVTAAVESDDERIKGTCMIILEEGDEGLFDRGVATHKLVHQLSSTRDPVFNMKVPADRIVGGYTVEDGVIIPNYSHGQILQAVFSRTRVTVALMTAAKLLSAVEPIIRYQRGRFRGSAAAAEGSPRYDYGIQQKEDALHRLVDVWASGEASASLGFTAARMFDVLDPLEKEKNAIFKEFAIEGTRAEFREMSRVRPKVIEYLDLMHKPEADRDAKRFDELESDPLVQYAFLEALTNVFCPACKLWNTGHGANMMREAVSLMGGYGITEDCPGFLGAKWMDAQLEATYEGPEAVQRRQLSVTMTDPVFLAWFRGAIHEIRDIAGRHPGTGACTLGTAMQMWAWTLQHLQGARDADGKKLYSSARQGVTFPLADALCWILSARALILDVLRLEEEGGERQAGGEGLAGTVAFLTDLCHVQTTLAAGEVGKICAELVYGYDRHPAWDKAGCEACYGAAELDSLEAIMPGIAAGASAYGDVVEEDGGHRPKAGPCARHHGIDAFVRMRTRMDGCLTGSRLAKDHAAAAIANVMIPEALDYPA